MTDTPSATLPPDSPWTAVIGAIPRQADPHVVLHTAGRITQDLLAATPTGALSGPLKDAAADVASTCAALNGHTSSQPPAGFTGAAARHAAAFDDADPDLLADATAGPLPVWAYTTAGNLASATNDWVTGNWTADAASAVIGSLLGWAAALHHTNDDR